MTSLPADSKAARVLDLALDLLLVSILLGGPLIFYTRAHDVFEFNKITVIRSLSSLAAALMLAKLFFVRPLQITRSPLDLPVVAWLMVALACTFNTVNWRLSVHGVYEDFEGITTLVNYAFLFWWPLQHIRTERQIRLVLGSVTLAGTIMGFYGILQNFGIDFVPWNPDTYSVERMFSTMGNPNFLAAYAVMSMPIAFAVFLDLPERIKVDKAFCLVLIVLGAMASVGLCSLFNVNYFNLDPKFYGATSFGEMLLTKKFIATKVLLIFPLVAAVLLYFGRLRWILLLSLLFQLVATLFTKSRGGIISMSALAVVFGLAFTWELGRWKAVLAAFAAALLGFAVFITGAWRWAFAAAFEHQRAACFVLLCGLLYGLTRLVAVKGKPGLLRENRHSMAALILLIWVAHYDDSIRNTTYQMLDRFQRLFDFGHFKYTPRLFIWRSALKILQDHFWLGTGLDTFQIAFPGYRLAIYWDLEWNGTPEKAHNMIMQIAATMGFLGLLTFFWIKAAFVAGVFRDWQSQPDPRRRFLLVACFGAVLGFLVQNLFSFTVVGYGSLYWILMGVLPAMQRTWAEENGLQALPGPGAQAAWKGGVLFLGLTGLACLLAGPTFFATDDLWPLRFGFSLAGAAALTMAVWTTDSSGWARRIALAAASLGLFFFSMHSIKIWVADSFYKQGQVGVQVNNPGYAAVMYQKSAGRLKDITAQQLNNIHLPMVSAPAERLNVQPGLNPDQELYWVKMGIAFENAASGSQKSEEKLVYFRTALAIHQLTLEMNPINGYNFNNKGRVLKSMGEAFGDAQYYQRALEHYDKAIALDENNVYFNLDKANVQMALGQTGAAFETCQKLTEKFPEFSVPYSYMGFMKMRAGQSADAIRYFQKAVDSDWKRDIGSKPLAATNLGLLYGQAGKDSEAVAAYSMGIASNPGFPEVYLNLANQHLRKGRPAEAVKVLDACLRAIPGHAGATDLLNKIKGATR